MGVVMRCGGVGGVVCGCVVAWLVAWCMDGWYCVALCGVASGEVWVVGGACGLRVGCVWCVVCGVV